MQSSTPSSAPCSKVGPTSSSTPSSSSLPTGYVSRASPHPSPTQGRCTSFADPLTCLPRFSAQSPLFFSEDPERLEPGLPRRGYISQLQLCSMTQLLEQDSQMEAVEEVLRSPGCNSHSMNFEQNSALQSTLDTWCLSPRSSELEGGLIIRRDQAGGYELEPIINPLANMDPALIFEDASLDVGAGPQRRQARNLDMKRDQRAADAEVSLDGAIFEDPLPQDNHYTDLSEEQSTDVYNKVVWNQELGPWIEQERRASDLEMNLIDGDVFEDPFAQGNLSIKYWEKWSMDTNDNIVVRLRESEKFREEHRSCGMDIPFHETALNVYSSSPFWFSTKTYKAALSDMLQPLLDNSSLHLFEEQGMNIYNDWVWNQRTSPWVRQDLRSSDMEIYFDEAVPEAYPTASFRPNPPPNKASVSDILRSPPVEDNNDRSPPLSPTKYRYTSPEKNIDYHFGPLYFNEAMPDAYTPSPLMPSIETHIASLSYTLGSPAADKSNYSSPPPSPRKPKSVVSDANLDDGGFSPGPFSISPSDDHARGLTESKIFPRSLIEKSPAIMETPKPRRGRPPGTRNKKTLSAAQSKKIAATALTRMETLRRRTSTQAGLPMTINSQEGNASKRRKKNKAELRPDHGSEEQPRRESGESEKRLTVLGRIEGHEQRKAMDHGGEGQENQQNWKRIAYDPDLW